MLGCSPTMAIPRKTGSPIYALRVIRRRRDLKRTLVVRAIEATRAASEVEDALFALAARIRATAGTQANYADAIAALARAEAVLRSREEELTTEHAEQAARLSSLDARLSKLEAESAKARAEEHAAAIELASLQAALANQEISLKRSPGGSDAERARSLNRTRQ